MGLGEEQLCPAQVICIVDDDESVRVGLSSLLRSFDYEVVGFESGIQLLAWIRNNRCSCIISDVQMPGMSGIEMFLHMVREDLLIPTIFITAYPTPELQQKALSHGACAFLIKPVAAKDLEALIGLYAEPRTD
ncbi:response regulator transcription factor [Paraburkholderia unamae]|uniref:Response regulator receiver domain-containing protein n=1 Tax=Paraburkholderia unamae TaxID=219649 RepID=A0ABX5KV72_9BURK|nr:response regulator [Paraburkholderia unamae]PVX85910.1 response regulator receiver domain-containing protein [Paraburkholderia unamae]